MEPSYSNPFGKINAVTLGDTDILRYWCSPFAYKLFEEVSEDDMLRDPNNIIVMGGRSTGKTMFLRYWSFPVQMHLARSASTSSRKSIIDHFREKGGFGYYLRIDGLVLRSFDGHGISTDTWNALFTHFLELRIGRLYLESLKMLHDEGDLDNDAVKKEFLPQAAKLFGRSDAKTFDDLLRFVDDAIDEVDDYRGSVPFTKSNFEPTVSFPARRLVFGIPDLAVKTLPSIDENLNFILLLDEYENFLVHQQRVVNTMLRFSTERVKLRIGMRLEGFRTTDTISSDDFVKEGREYRKVVIEEVLVKSSDYRGFLREICHKRLASIPQFREQNLTDIVSFLGDKEEFEQEAATIASKNPGQILRYFAKHINSETADQIRCEGNPLLEMLNVLWVLRGHKGRETKQAMDGFLAGDQNSPLVKKYRRDYIDKYRLSLLFLVAMIYRSDKHYYSFNTFAFLSSGIVGNFIALCQRAFQYAEFEEREQLLELGKISIEQQHNAAVHVSESELQQLVRIEAHGNKIYKFVKNLGNAFRAFHRDVRIRYPETNQFTADINFIGEEESSSAFRAAIKWSSIQRKPRLQSQAPGKSVTDIYTINHIFAPAFQISYRTRGGYSLHLGESHVKLMMEEGDFDVTPLVPKERDSSKGAAAQLELRLEDDA